MSITRINEFTAKEGQGDSLRDLLRLFLATLDSAAGCQSCQVLQSAEHPTRIVVIEVWDSMEAHQASVKNIAPEALAQIMPLLDGTPKGEYFS
jgi:quinol monooxygenase YgiN